MTTGTVRLELMIIPQLALNIHKVEAVLVVSNKLIDCVALDGTIYTMDYGVVDVFDRITFDKPVTRKSKAICNAVAKLQEKYPTATITV